MAIAAPPSNLSANDARVLNALFDPETLPSSVAKSKDATPIDPSLPPHASISTTKLSALENQQNDIVRRVSSSSSIEDIDTAISELDRVVSQEPNYASAYINRAMLLRLKLESQLAAAQHIFSLPTASIQPLFTDLSRAIHVSLPSSSPTAPVSPYQAKKLRTAYSHRAYLYLKAAEIGTSLQGLEKSELEELASKDFAGAARYGDEAAREMSVRTNPYAKMCGAIVRNALKEEMKGEGV
ncbi:hypothetical protein CC86DRAFT_370214 [Ophiobolus disseminans]|uniref:Tetratricopeptide repeat protein 36 n=1 Tax=Ophiobolus disseminans TaxID=1469910 RepID=A0A6A7A085_9PLEO|nr:hypothetical protein CC86DRAFT_370214 [Ophiobolus disseminans]